MKGEFLFNSSILILPIKKKSLPFDVFWPAHPAPLSLPKGLHLCHCSLCYSATSFPMILKKYIPNLLLSSFFFVCLFLCSCCSLDTVDHPFFLESLSPLSWQDLGIFWASSFSSWHHFPKLKSLPCCHCPSWPDPGWPDSVRLRVGIRNSCIPYR